MFSKSIIKYIQSLQHKKFRDEHNAFIAEGPKVVAELLQGAHFNCKNIYATAEWINISKSLPPACLDKLTEVKEFELEKMTGLSSPNLVVAEFEKKKPGAIVNFNKKLTLVLDDIRDPGNFGTIIRTADWFGIENIVCSFNTVDMYNPKVVQSTMASLGRVNVIYTDLLEHFQHNHSIKTYAAALQGRSLKDMGPVKEGMIIIGNESSGISNEISGVATEKITIPGYGAAESLNAAVATGIILYAVKGSGEWEVGEMQSHKS